MIGLNGFNSERQDFDISDVADEYFHALYYAEDGLDGGLWVPRYGTGDATPSGTPGTTTINGRTVWDLDGIDDIFTQSAGVSGIHGFVALARHDDATFPSYDGLIGPPGGGTVGLVGNLGGTGFVTSGQFGNTISWNEEPASNTGYLPCSPNLSPIITQRKFVSVDYSSGWIIGQDRAFTNRRWDGQIGVIGILKKHMPLDVWSRIVSQWARYFEFETIIHPNAEWVNKFPPPLPNRTTKTLINDNDSIFQYTSVRGNPRSSAFRDMPDLIGTNIADVKQVGGLQMFIPAGGAQTYINMDMTTWNTSGSVTTPISAMNTVEDEVFEFTVSGEGFIYDTYTVGSHTGNNHARCLARLIDGTINSDSYMSFYNVNSQVGNRVDLTQLNNQWKLLDAVLAGTSDRVRFDFTAGTNATIQIRKMRNQPNFLQPFPGPSITVPTGTASGTDSAFTLSFQNSPWPSAATFAFLMKPYGGWNGLGVGPEGPPFAAMRIFSIGNWHIRNAADPVLRAAGVDVITATDRYIKNDWQIIWFDYNGSEVGMQWGVDDTRLTAASANIPSGSLYVGNESAVNQSHCFTCILAFNEIVSQTDRKNIEYELINTARNSRIKEQ